MLVGARILSTGQRRDDLLVEIEATFSVDMANRVLAYDEAAAEAHAQIAAIRRWWGRTAVSPT